MRVQRMARCLICLILTGVLAIGLFPTTARAGTKEVRVGLYEKENYHTIDQDGRHAGYDYEYLNKIAYYTGWKFTYVSATWDECMEMLISGEIDILGGVEQTPQREDRMLFPTIATMSSVNCLLQQFGSGKYAFEDYESFDGMRIGILQGSNQINSVRLLSRKVGFTYTPVLYETETEMQQALEAGEVDCLCLDSCRDLSPYSILCYFDYKPLYYAVSPARPDLCDELQGALEMLRVQEPEFEYNLYSQYFEYAQSISLTKAEQAYVKNRGPVRVALNMEVCTLLCRWDEEKGEYVGLMPDTLALLSERTGLRFEYVAMPDGGTPADYFEEHPAEIVAPAMISSLINHDRGFILLDPIYRGKMLTITQSGRSLNADRPFLLAVPARLFAQEDTIDALFPGAIRVPCKTHRQGMQMVASGDADMALVNEFTASYEMQSPYFETLQSANFSDITEDLTLGLSRNADHELVSILTKGILSLSERDTRDIVLKNTAAVSYEMSLAEFLYRRRYTVVLVCIMAAGAFVLFSERKRYLENRRKDRESLLAAEERLRADQEYQKRMFRQANFDELTGLYNQKYFVEKSNERMAANPDQVFRFLWINLTGFRMFNDLYGIEAGNAVLLDMAECMRTCIGESGVYGRMYADRFAVCIPTDCEINFMDKCIRKVDFRGKRLRIHVAIGVYQDDQKCRDAARCMNYALIALENRSPADASPISFFSSAQLESMRTKQMITNDMERALEREEFKIYLQPQYDLDGDKLVGAEALARWDHPEHGMISPAVFIPVFESNHFIHKLSAYMCDHVCAMLAEWLAEGKAVPVSLNLSQLDLGNPELIPMLLRTLEKYEVPTRYLCLEITESAYAKSQQQAIAIIDKLRGLGFRVEMDDFGSGYSSLNMLKDMNLDAVKLDMKFLGKGTDSRRATQIIDFIVQMVHAIGEYIIVEGVETKQDADFLQTIGCHFVQGYLYGRPIPAENFAARLAKSNIGQKL